MSNNSNVPLKHVVGPTGGPLTVEDLPSPGTQR